jgi:hypothetical protein
MSVAKKSNPALWERAKSQAIIKVCSTCKVEKPLTEFTSNRFMLSGYMTYCKDCNNKRNKRYRGDNTNLTRACKRVLGYINRRCRLKSMSIDIDYQYVESLYNSQNGLCAYTKEKMELGSNSRNTLSIDRIDSSLGYIKSNIVLTTWKVNNCKQDLSLQEFKELCKMVVDNGKD